MNFLNFGYYIVEPMPTPEYLNIKCKQVITVTNCICNIHPSLTGTFYVDCEKQQQEYKSSLRLEDDVFTELKENVLLLDNEHKLDVDSRFIELSDALLFCKKYLYNLSNIKVISIALEDIYKEIFIQDAGENLNCNLLIHKKCDGNFLGYDILGWDWSAFHSYLCNSLNEDISEKYSLEINDNGLISNLYFQVKDFSEFIDGKGEPVIWLPYSVYEHDME